MRALLQRVKRGAVTIGAERVAEIGAGLVVLLGVGQGDTAEQAAWLAQKTAALRIFEDQDGKINRSILESGGEALVVSQFTLYADTSKGRRPSFVHAEQPDAAEPLVQAYAEALRQEGVPTQTGRFGALMLVDIVNDGPFTIMLERSPDSHQ
jgi:D-tyrosyl-tRNA(Tyr) deacylase